MDNTIILSKIVTIDWSIVYAIITKHLDDFRNYAHEIMQWIDRNPQ